ncbi:MAG TPA: hypothetical protein VHD83_13335 [Puia sp.]|nr:hypothetical protein [Puia sp.]
MRLKIPGLPQDSVLFLSLLIFLFPLFLLEYPILQYSNGLFIYPFDEEYIRMATAKNLAFHGVWGLLGTEFSSASSSILYPLLLAVLYKVFGLWSGIPFVVNLLTALLLIWVVKRWLQKQGLTPWAQFLTLSAIILLTPLPTLVMTGMEHSLQMLVTFLFVGRLFGRDREPDWKLYLLGMLLTGIRYEGIFVIAVAAIYLLYKRRMMQALMLLLTSLLPIVMFGWYSLSKGGYFVPNSLLIKAMPIPLDGENIQKFIISDIFTRLVFSYNTASAIATSRLVLILPILYGVFYDQLKEQPLYRKILLASLVVTILHLALSSTVFYFRYEAYLIAGALLIGGVLFSRYGGGVWSGKAGAARWVAVWAGLVLVIPMIKRGWQAYGDTSTACFRTYEQSYQAARFIRQYYNGASVVSDDIGITSYLSDGIKLDLYNGIGYTPAVRAREESYFQVVYARDVINREKATLAIVEEFKYSPSLLYYWRKVATWGTNNKVVLHSPQLSIYALTKADSAGLSNKLRDFQPSLPGSVLVTYP